MQLCDILLKIKPKEGNILSFGAALGIDRGEPLLGVMFTNTGGRGQICYRLDYKTNRCVGSVRGVSMFKGSRWVSAHAVKYSSSSNGSQLRMRDPLKSFLVWKLSLETNSR